MLEKTLESPLDCKEIQPVNPKGNQPWIIIGRIDAEAPILWPPDAKSWLIRKDPDAGKDWGQEEKWMTGWMASLTQWTRIWTNCKRFEGQGSLTCCSPQVAKIQTRLRPSVQFSCSVVSDSLRPHESQHARPPCPSPTPGVYPNPCPSSQWWHPAISCPGSTPRTPSKPASVPSQLPVLVAGLTIHGSL